MLFALVVAGGARRAYRLLASGAATVDVGIGRRTQRLGPLSWRIGASREAVFDGPLSGADTACAPGQTGGMGAGLGHGARGALHLREMWSHDDRGNGSLLASRADRLPRCPRPVPHVIESFVLDAVDEGTSLTWDGELGTDFWVLGAWWGSRVARSWEKAVRSSLDAVVAEAERRNRGRESARKDEGHARG